jgi:hypothetical protein
VDRSITQGPAGSDRRSDEGARALGRPQEPVPSAWRRRLIDGVGLGIVAVALAVYTIQSVVASNNIYNHFVWQASAWLEGETAIAYPVTAADGQPGNEYFNDVVDVLDANDAPTGRGILPFPPLPALVLLPFVKLWGLVTDEQRISAILGAFDVGLAFWMLGRLGIRASIRIAVTVFFAFGTVFWYTAEKGSTWYFAHVVAVGLTLLAVGIALGADRAAVEDAVGGPVDRADEAPGRWWSPARWGWHGVGTLIDWRQFLAGFLLGLAATARLTVIFGAPFLVFVGGGGSWLRRGFSAGLGALVPVIGLLVYNQLSTGHWFNPAYETLYQQEAGFYTFLNYNADWAIEDVRYIPANLGLMLVGPPDIMPTVLPFGQELCAAGHAVRGWLDPDCPIIAPRQVGMGLLLTSPAWLLGVGAVRRFGWNRLVTGCVSAVVLIALVNVAHFSQGWVQFGYRFSNDFAPFALVLLALAMQWRGRIGWLAGGLIGLSIAVNLWGVYWGGAYGW